MTHLDTSFLVDLLRELRRDEFLSASEYLEALPDAEVLAVSVHVVCELMAGAGHPRAPKGEVGRLTRLCDALLIRHPDERFAPTYARLLTSIRRAGATIDTMDLLIATAAVLDGAALVTRNQRHFSKVPGLVLAEY